MYYVVILKERHILRKEKLCQGAVSLLLSADKNSHRYQMGYPHFYCTCNIFYSATMHLRGPCAQEDQVLILMKTLPFQSWINFLLSFGSLGNHQTTNVYKRIVVGICNRRMRKDHSFWQKHGLRSLLVENETVSLDKRSINRINHLKRIH